MQAVTTHRLSPRIGVRTVLSGIILALGLFAFVPAARADNIDLKLLEDTPQILDYLHKQNYKSVGVLPFRVEKNKQPPSYGVGPMNTNMATRLERALVAKNDPKKPLNILHDPAKAAGRRSLTVKTAAGRRSLLDNQYELAWGNTRQKPAVLLTGDVKLSADNRRVTVIIKAFASANAEPRIVHQFATNTDRSILADCAQSFQLSRGLIRKRDVTDVELDQAAADSATLGDNTNKPDTNSDVQLVILYDGSPVQMEMDSSNPGERKVRLRRGARSGVPGTVVSPVDGQKLSLVIENSSTTETYAVVVKVNGKNTLYEQEDDAIKCSKWVLDPAKSAGTPTRYELKGFYISESGDNLKQFRILSEEESKAKEEEMQGNDNLGLIDFYVFKQGAGEMKSSRQVSLRPAASRNIKPTAKPKSAAEAAKQIRTAMNAKQGKRNVIWASDKITADGTITKVSFDNPIEVLHQSIRYHTSSQASGTGSANP